jgi:hypothetical protein
MNDKEISTVVFGLRCLQTYVDTKDIRDLDMLHADEIQGLIDRLLADEAPTVVITVEGEQEDERGSAYMTDEEYVAVNGCHCPVCRSREIEGGETDMGGSHATQECSCNACESAWVDVYKLIGYDQLSDNTPEPEDAP